MKDGDYPLGIKYWVQYFKHTKPRMEVYRCIGVSEYDNQNYLFQAIKTGTFVTKNWNDLNRDGFKPFFIPVDKLKKLQEEGDF